MNFENEKDYIMRLIKEMVRMLISFVLGKQYAHAELPRENKYGVSDEKIVRLKAMVDGGEINEAENMLLDKLDYTNKEAVAELIFFYEYTNEKDMSFLKQHNYSHEEVLDGLKQLAKRTGYQNMVDMLEE